MTLQISKDILFNLLLLVAMSAFYELFAGIFPRRWKARPLLVGALAAGIGLLLMGGTVVLAPGIVLDARTILIAVASQVYGPIATAVVVVALGLYRALAIGGPGAPAAVAAMVLIGSLGLLWKRLDLRSRLRSPWLSAYLYGLAAHVLMVLCSFLIPGPAGLWTLGRIALPVLTLYPVVTMLLLRLLEEQEARLVLRERALDDLVRYRSLFDSRYAVMLIIDPDSGRILDANQNAVDFYGWTRDELRKMTIDRINTLPPDEVRAEMARSVREGRHMFRFRHRRKDGSIRDVEVYGGPIPFHGRTALHSIIHDVTEQAAVAQALVRSELRAQTVLESVPYGIFIQTRGVIRFANRTAARYFGAEDPTELEGVPIFARFDPAFHDVIRGRIARVSQNLPVEDTEVRFLRLDGQAFDVDVRAVPIHYVGPSHEASRPEDLEEDGILVFFQDITERKRLEREKRDAEARLVQQHKLEAIGTLASGVAHEINNPVFGIRNFAELVLEDVPRDSADAQYLRTIIGETDRIAGIVANLLQFSRVDRQTHSAARAVDLVDRTLALLRPLLQKDGIRIDVDVPADLPLLRCRSQQIQQVLMNLLTNARDAVNAKHGADAAGKRIAIAARTEEADGRGWIRISVRDSGDGIPDGIRDRIFDPFFTTKPKEMGTGLGLSISFGIVRDHDGRIEIDTMPGEYTDMQVVLPADADEAPSEAISPEDPPR